MGVGPCGAHVRRRVGMSRKPLSSRKASCAPRRRAFFYRGPSVTLPVGNGRCVPWDRLALGDLTAPAQTAQDLSDRGGVIPHPKVHLHHGRDASQGPERVGEALRCGALPQQVLPLVALLVWQLARSSGHRRGGQGRLAAGLPGLPPLVDCSDRRLHPARDRAQGQALLEQRDGAASASF